MADLNDDIKKYLRGELSPAEMHALEKKALNDPFLEDALEGAAGLDKTSFDTDLNDLRLSLKERIAERNERTVSLWVWPSRIAAGLILVALSTFVIIKLTENKSESDLALNKDSVEQPKESGDPSATTDSSEEIQGVVPGIASESQRGSAKPQPSEDAAAGQALAKSEAEVSEPAELTDKDELPQKADDAEERIAATTESIPADHAFRDSVTIAGSEGEAKKSKEAGNLTYEQQQRRLSSTAPAAGAKASQAYVPASSKVIRGRVESADGIGLPGVNVMIKDTNIGTVTDNSGNYQISVTDKNPDLVFSYIGFTSEEVAAGDKTQINVRLNEDVSQLSEIVVVGYIADRKTDDEKPETLELANPYGGRRAYKQYLERNMRYPEQALANNIEGKVTIQFTVESSGVLSNFNVIKGIGYGCDEEVIRLIQQGPKWNPTRRNTESLRDRVKVRMKFTLPKK